MQKIKLKREPDYKPIFEPFDYQKNAVDYIYDLDYAAIFHEQGLGKSKIAIDLALKWLSAGVLDTILFVCKKSLAENWTNEFKVHSHVKPKQLIGNSGQVGLTLLSPVRVIICHYELVKKFSSSIQMFCTTRNTGIFLDESQKIKNPNSALTTAFHDLSVHFKKRVIITGTPIANRPHDIWAQIYFLDGGSSLGNNFKDFRSGLELDNNLHDNEMLQNDYKISLRKIFPVLSKFAVRETKDGNIIDLPDKLFSTYDCDWEPRQWDLYHDLKIDLTTFVVKNNEIVEEIAKEVLKRILRLQQICSCPHSIDESYKALPGKIQILDERLDEISYRGEKCIIWTQFTATADYLSKYLKHQGATKVTGKLSIEIRNQNIHKFKTQKDCKILVATYGAAKEGLTLTVANNAIFYDRSLSLDDYIQSQDRIHRISQENTCNFYILQMSNSIESWVDNLLNAKHASAKLAMQDIDEQVFKEMMTFNFGDELKKCLGIDND